MSTDHKFISWNLQDVTVGEPLPAPIYLYIDHRFITFRAEADSLDRKAYERLFLKQVKQVFIKETDLGKFEAWRDRQNANDLQPSSDQERAFMKAREDSKRAMLDIFSNQHPNKVVMKGLESSKKLVAEVMKGPFTSRPILKLQALPKDMIDHSVNVSVLSVYLAMHMGISNALSLSHIGAGALFHDIGKLKVRIKDEDTTSDYEEKMKAHPELGFALLGEVEGIAEEVKSIVMQHHEFHDGSGFPGHLKANQIHEWAKIVSLANLFDDLVASSKGDLQARQKAAISQLDQVLCNKFDPLKLDKALKTLKLGL